MTAIVSECRKTVIRASAAAAAAARGNTRRDEVMYGQGNDYGVHRKQAAAKLMRTSQPSIRRRQHAWRCTMSTNLKR